MDNRRVAGSMEVAKKSILGKPGSVVSVEFARGEMTYKVSLTRERIFPGDAKSSPYGNAPAGATGPDVGTCGVCALYIRCRSQELTTDTPSIPAAFLSCPAGSMSHVDESPLSPVTSRPSAEHQNASRTGNASPRVLEIHPVSVSRQGQRVVPQRSDLSTSASTARRQGQADDNRNAAGRGAAGGKEFDGGSDRGQHNGGGTARGGSDATGEVQRFDAKDKWKAHEKLFADTKREGLEGLRGCAGLGRWNETASTLEDSLQRMKARSVTRAMLEESMESMETPTAGEDNEIGDATAVSDSVGSSRRSSLAPSVGARSVTEEISELEANLKLASDLLSGTRPGSGARSVQDGHEARGVNESRSDAERTWAHVEPVSSARHSKGLYHGESRVQIALRDKLLADDAAVVGAFSAQSIAQHSMQVMCHFYEAAINMKHPLYRRVQELGAELASQADALSRSAAAGDSVPQHDINVLSNKINNGLQSIVEELRIPLQLHAKPDEVVAALWGGIEEALYRGSLHVLWNYYRCATFKEEELIKQQLAKLQPLSPADISRAGGEDERASGEWGGVEVLPSDSAKAKENLAAAIEAAKSLQLWSAPVAKLLALQSCSSDVARGLGLEETGAAITSVVTLPSLVFVLIQAGVSDISSTNALLSDMLWEGMLAQDLGYCAATWDSVTAFLLEQASSSSTDSRPVSGAIEAAAAVPQPAEADTARGSGGKDGESGGKPLDEQQETGDNDRRSRDDAAVPARRQALARRPARAEDRRPQKETPKLARDPSCHMTPLEWEEERYVYACVDASEHVEYACMRPCVLRVACMRVCLRTLSVHVGVFV